MPSEPSPADIAKAAEEVIGRLEAEVKSLRAERDEQAYREVETAKVVAKVATERDALEMRLAEALGERDGYKERCEDAAELVDQADDEHANDISVVVSQRKALSAANALLAESADEKTLLQAKVDVAENACATHEDVAKSMAVRLNEKDSVINTMAVAACLFGKEIDELKDDKKTLLGALTALGMCARSVPIVRRNDEPPFSTCLGCDATDPDDCKPSCWVHLLEIGIERARVALEASYD